MISRAAKSNGTDQPAHHKNAAETKTKVAATSYDSHGGRLYVGTYVGHFSSRYHARVIFPPYNWSLQGYTYFPNYFLFKHKLLVPATYWVRGDKKYTMMIP